MFSIIIINWNSFEDTIACINSILPSSGLISKILVVDNASSDNSFSKLECSIQIIENDVIELIKSDINTGYCGGNNLGFSYCMENLGEYILVLNNDVKVSEMTLPLLKEAFDSNSKLAIVSPMVNGKIIYNSPFLKKISDKIGIQFRPEDIGGDLTLKHYVPGCAIAFKKDFLKKCGGFDPNYFMYVEEIEIAFRAWMNGYKVAQINSARANIERKKDDDEKLNKPYVWYYQTRNMLYFIDKLFQNNRRTGRGEKMVYILYSLVRPVKQKKINNIIPVIQGIIDYFLGRTGKK